MILKIFAVGKGGAFLKLGKNFGDAEWYATEKVTKDSKELDKGHTVDVESELQGKARFLTSIKKVVADEVATNYPKDVVAKPSLEKPVYLAGRNSENTSELIRRQSIGNMASRAIIALKGVVTEDNICDIVEKLYTKFDELTTR